MTNKLYLSVFKIHVVDVPQKKDKHIQIFEITRIDDNKRTHIITIPPRAKSWRRSCPSCKQNQGTGQTRDGSSNSPWRNLAQTE